MPSLKNSVARIFNRRIRVVGDDNARTEILYDGRYRWMALNNLKVSPRILDQILENRSLADTFTLRNDKRLALIIPFRNREAHLQKLIPLLKEKLHEAQIEHTVFVTEQCDDKLFNRGKLLNVGATIAGDAYDYYCLHDVDMLPQDCTYACPSAPLRLYSTIISGDSTRQVSSVCFGGMVTIAREHFLAANGFSNEFWHWGKEDDNFLLRLLLKGIGPAVDTQGAFVEIAGSTDRHRVKQSSSAAQNKKEGEAHIDRNKRRQHNIARGLIPPYDEGLSTLEFELLEKVEHEQYTQLRVNL